MIRMEKLQPAADKDIARARGDTSLPLTHQGFAMLMRMPLVILLLTQVAAPATAQTMVTGQQAFAVCSACHSVKPGEKRMGPNLFGVLGRKAGSVAGYAYSPAFAKLGTKWTASELDQYLKSPQKTVPGTKMFFGGIADDARRRAVIGYLATLK